MLLPAIFIIILINSVFNFDIKSITKIKIKLENGQLLIGNRKLIDDKIIYELFGVPFAKAPIGEKRFEFPHRLDDILTSNVYDATQPKLSCTQVPDTTFNRTFRGAEIWNTQDETSEDCLYMNMWVPIKREYDEMFLNESNKMNNSEIRFVNISKFASDKQLTSLFWIYGGSFITGSINLNVYDGTVIAFKENIIVVSANYRLGAFGFLYYNHTRIPGNAGLMDQLLAIEWYKKYYERLFNAKNICVYGESAGAMSIHFHALNLNENTKNLFNCAIIQSGTGYLDIAYRKPDEAFQITQKLAELTNCNNKNESIIDCLKNLDRNIILDNQAFFYNQDYVNTYLPMPFVPTTDFFNYLKVIPFVSSKKVLMKKYDTLKNMNFMSGINNDEGGFFLFYAFLNQYYNLTHIDPIDSSGDDGYEFIIKILTKLLHTKNNRENNDLPEFSKCLNDVYKGNNDFHETFCEINVWKKIMKIVGDIIFSCPTIQLFENLNSIKVKNNFFYKFSYKSTSNVWPSWIGTSHGM
jgi:carboxylesterase type B